MVYPTKSISGRASKGRGIWFLICFFSIFFFIGGSLFYGFFVRPLLKILDAQRWVETPCLILSSSVESHPGSESTTYSIDIVYTYRVQGKEFRSDRYDFMEGSSSGYDSKMEIVSRYHPGENAVCYVNPSDPTDAVLNRGFTNDMFFGLIPLVFVLVGAGGLFFSVRGLLRKRKEAIDTAWRHQEVLIAGEQAASLGLPRPAVPDGPTVLEATVSPKGKFVGMMIFCIFWNGIVSIFVWFAIQGWLNNDPEWFLIIFLIPFVVIGLGSIGGVGYFFLALFNPRPRLVVSSSSISLGGSLDLEWQLSGRAHLVERFRISLQGREEATYRRGTRTYTDREVFATIPLVDAPSPINPYGGRIRFTIPHDTIHSFKSDNNKIVWSLIVEGDIRRWPNINDEFEINVLPLSQRSGR